jgi:ribosomal protein S18 acetylase RimI-like enzyme
MHSLPEKNKYTNFKNIETFDFNKISNLKMKKFIQFIKLHYLQKKDNYFNPKENNILPYFHGHNTYSFFSFYQIEEKMMDVKNNSIIINQKLIAGMTSRPLHVVIHNGNKDAKFDAYYVDYLCVDNSFRKQGIAPEMIQTHEYIQRHLNKSIAVSLFKREGELTGIVPLVVYSTYGFHVKKWSKPLELHAMYSIIEITSNNIHYLHDFLQEQSKLFDIYIFPEWTNLIELLKTENIFIYVVMMEQKIICAYFFKKTCTFIDINLEVLTCFASINKGKKEVFIQGYKNIFWKIADKYHFGFSAIENISHNNIIIQNIIIKTKPYIVSPTAYFFYNFAYPTFKPEKTFIMS